MTTGLPNWRFATIEELRTALCEGVLTCERLIQHHLDRIARFDQVGPRINALITVNPNALEQARQLDRDRAKGVMHAGTLYGIPFIAKDNIDTLGVATSGGSAALRHSVPSANATVIQQLLDQGAILLGKANMSELAASHGWFGYGSASGLTLNPFNTARDAAGSSSGSAAAVAAEFAPFALGTDTAGSVRAPASVAGVVGLRPTLGLVSCSGVIPLALSFDTPGVLARSVQDIATVLDVIAGAYPQATPSAGYSPDPAPSLVGVRLGVVSNFRGGNAEVDGVEDAARARLAAAGAVLVAVELPAPFADLWNTLLRPVGEAEFMPQFERYLGTLDVSQPKTLAQVIAIGESRDVVNSRYPVNPARLEALRVAAASVPEDGSAHAGRVQRDISAIRQQLAAVMHGGKFEALVFSTMSCPASPRFDRPDPSYCCTDVDPYRAGYVAAAAGYPEISVPAGRVSANIPVGISFLGLPRTERCLLTIAKAFELSSPAWDPPLP
jgi:amidase